MHKRMQKAVKVVSELELESVSPKLLNIKNLSIAIPGMYSPEKRFDFVRIRQFYRVLTVLQSKQRPRKIIIIGSDNNKYEFLLKGNEDLRQVIFLLIIYSFYRMNVLCSSLQWSIVFLL